MVFKSNHQLTAMVKIMKLNETLSKDQLWMRGWFLVGYCCMCKDAEESVDYLLIHCGKAIGLWHFLFSLFGISWVLPYSMEDLLMGAL